LIRLFCKIYVSSIAVLARRRFWRRPLPPKLNCLSTKFIKKLLKYKDFNEKKVTKKSLKSWPVEVWRSAGLRFSEKYQAYNKNF
jgi:hypothetical protein